MDTETFIARGQKIYLREFTRADVDEWVNWPPHVDPLFQDYNPPRLSPLERDIWYIEHASRSDMMLFAIADEDGKLIGRLFLRQVDRSKKSAVLGIDLRSDKLDKGYGTDALQTFARYYFEVLGYKVLRLDVAAFNRRAQRVYEKVGFIYTGEHWSSYPPPYFSEVFSEDKYENIRGYFRRTGSGISVKHYDMELTRDRWSERQKYEG
ncbi:GNAT family N-acetyltransferase [Thermobaculum terrenum]|uniref:GNAT family N-acetyltransferase n=1 Tax=Thermobaculum terrenum TaxID=166501 RepID=UPI00019BF196|nr:GNAT family protein [Thermobaculum terrenum]